MAHLQYCKKCIIPSSRPHTFIDNEGICSGCRNYEYRENINWDKRKKLLIQTIENHRNNTGYDCIIPCSGGKDSTIQVLTIKELGFNPLVVIVTPCHPTEIGRKNIENVKNIGVDSVEITTNPVFRRKLNKYCLNLVGDLSWPEAVAIWCNVARTSINYKIPLIIWGENPENENGGPKKNSDVNVDEIATHNHRWMEEFGGTLGLRASDILFDLKKDGVTEKDIIPYTYPSIDEIKKNKTLGVFLGYFLPWDGHAHSIKAKNNGFQEYHKNVEGNIVPYENLDNYQKRIHDYFKYLKYGYDRVNDWGSLAIRRNRLSRDEAVQYSIDISGKYPWEYMGKSLEEILSFIDVTIDEFDIICDKFTNKELFKKDNEGKLIKDNLGNITKNNYDNIK